MTNNEMLRQISKIRDSLEEIEREIQYRENSKYQTKLKVGDRVRFRSWEELCKKFQLNEDGDIEITCICFASGMRHLCGTYATIKFINRSYVELEDFSTDGNTKFTYILEMLEPVISEGFNFTEDEKVILRNLPLGYNYIVRDEANNIIELYGEKPIKYNESGCWCSSDSDEFRVALLEFNHLFQTIQWGKEPCEFRKYL